jgi:hypothetical protein
MTAEVRFLKSQVYLMRRPRSRYLLRPAQLTVYVA